MVVGAIVIGRATGQRMAGPPFLLGLTMRNRLGGRNGGGQGDEQRDHPKKHPRRSETFLEQKLEQS